MLKFRLPNNKIAEFKESTRVSVRLLSLTWNVDKVLLIGVGVSVLLPAVIPFINIYVYKLVIDLVVSIVGGAVFDPAQFYPLIALRVGTYFLQDVAFGTQEYVDRLLWSKTPMYISEMVIAKIATLDIQYFEDSKFRDLLEKARESYNYRPQQLVSNIFYMFQSLISVSIAFVALIKLNWLFMFLIFAVAIPEFFSQSQRSKLSWGLWSQNAPLRKRYGYLQHILQGPREVKEVRIFGLIKKFMGEIKGLHRIFYKDNIKIAKQNYVFNLFFGGISTTLFVGVEVYVILGVLAKRLTVGDVNFYTGVVSNFQNGLSGALRNLNGIFENSLYVKNIFDVIDLEPTIQNCENPVVISTKKAPRIEFKNVGFSYPGSKKYVLKDFNLVINPGEKVAFVGENGAGKSTIIKLLARFYDTLEGEILVDGVNIKNLEIDNWYRILGILFQDFNRYDHTVRENIEFGRVYDELQLSEVMKAAVSAGAHQMISKLEKGYEQMLGKTFEEGVELSGGQWQKIALSRAFLRNAPVLVLDEPTSSLDAKAESEIFSRVEKLSKDKTVIIISHRFSTVRNADKIYVIDNGKITEAGSHPELMKLNGQYATLFNIQAKGYQ